MCKGNNKWNRVWQRWTNQRPLGLYLCAIVSYSGFFIIRRGDLKHRAILRKTIANYEYGWTNPYK